jgi:hypothetical protein
MVYGGFVLAAMSPEEAEQLGGKELTETGSIRAGNTDGTIPEYTGGLTKPPPGFDVKSGNWPDPFADEKPLFSINAANMNMYADKLTDGAMEVMKRYPDWRIDVYKTHRSYYYPQWILDNTKKFATKARTADEGLSLVDVHAAVPFPIPKNGVETIWNHLTTFVSQAVDFRSGKIIVDRSGRKIVASRVVSPWDYPYWDPKKPSGINDYLYRSMGEFPFPPRLGGQVLIIHMPLNLGKRPQTSWVYLPGQRRIKLAPEVGYDNPVVENGGFDVYDEQQMFCGKIDRYNWKLLGRKEMYVTYNCYRAVFNGKDTDLKPKFPDPAAVRWELHRVWVLEATLKPGARHTYHKRIMYLDEDSWIILAATTYDAHGGFYTAAFSLYTPFYGKGGAFNQSRFLFNLASGGYLMNSSDVYPAEKVWVSEPRPIAYYEPDRIAAEFGIR